jgi:FlaA1/EpsC-like NDP-sugar epimerase
VIRQRSEEFSRVIRAVVSSAVVLGLLGPTLQALTARPWVFDLKPLAGVLAMGHRLVLRGRLDRLREQGRHGLPVLAVGAVGSLNDLIDRTRPDTTRGWTISGVCTSARVAPNGTDGILGFPALGNLDSAAEVAREGRHRVAAVCAPPGWNPRRLHQPAWSLESQATAKLVVDPGLMEMAGPRLHVDPVDRLPCCG